MLKVLTSVSVGEGTRLQLSFPFTFQYNFKAYNIKACLANIVNNVVNKWKKKRTRFSCPTDCAKKCYFKFDFSYSILTMRGDPWGKFFVDSNFLEPQKLMNVYAFFERSLLQLPWFVWTFWPIEVVVVLLRDTFFIVKLHKVKALKCPIFGTTSWNTPLRWLKKGCLKVSFSLCWSGKLSAHFLLKALGSRLNAQRARHAPGPCDLPFFENKRTRQT